MLYQLAGFGTLHFVLRKPTNWAINMGILGLIIGTYVANREAAYEWERQPRQPARARSMALTVFYGVLKLRRMQADYVRRCPPKDPNRAVTLRPNRKKARSCGGSAIEVKTRPASTISASLRTTVLRARSIRCSLTRHPTRTPLHIARGFALVGNDLYIANAWRKDSHVVRYRRHGDTFRFADIVVATKHVSAMVHPFDVELGDDGRLYVSCQDTNTVVAILPKTRKPAAVAPHLRKRFPDGNFLPGTLVASSQGQLPEVGDRAPRDVPSPQGLQVVLDEHGKPRHSVRGIIVYRKHLYVADEAGRRY